MLWYVLVLVYIKSAGDAPHFRQIVFVAWHSIAFSRHNFEKCRSHSSIGNSAVLCICALCCCTHRNTILYMKQMRNAFICVAASFAVGTSTTVLYRTHQTVTGQLSSCPFYKCYEVLFVQMLDCCPANCTRRSISNTFLFYEA